MLFEGNTYSMNLKHHQCDPGYNQMLALLNSFDYVSSLLLVPITVSPCSLFVEIRNTLHETNRSRSYLVIMKSESVYYSSN